jgi:YD repeat-containing protein
MTGFSAVAQTSPNESDQPVRVNITVNPDGTRTTYQFDQARREATAITTTVQGKVTQKIKYQIDEAGRFSTGMVFGPNDKFLYKTAYKYTPEGRLGEETHLDQKDTLVNKLVYSYDANGRQTGYVVYDASGNVIGRTSPVQGKGAGSPKPEKKKR